MARSLERKGHHRRAIEAYERIIEEHDSTLAYHRLAILRDQQGDFAASSEMFAEALRRQPENAELLCDMGYSQYLQGNDQEAAEILNQALRLEPESPRAHNNLALVNVRQEDYDLAFEEFARASKSYGTAHLNLAYALSMNGQFQRAQIHAQQALKIDSQSEKAQQLIGNLERVTAHQVADHAPALQAHPTTTEPPAAIPSQPRGLTSIPTSAPTEKSVGSPPSGLFRPVSVTLGDPLLPDAREPLPMIGERDPQATNQSEIRFAIPLDRGEIR